MYMVQGLRLGYPLYPLNRTQTHVSQIKDSPPGQWIKPQCNRRIFLHHERFFFTLIVEENFKVPASTDNTQAMLKI